MGDDFMWLLAIQGGLHAVTFLNMTARSPLDRPVSPAGNRAFALVGDVACFSAVALGVYSLWALGIWAGLLAFFGASVIGVVVEQICPKGPRPGIAHLIFVGTLVAFAVWLF